jgi:hypothetical protein
MLEVGDGQDAVAVPWRTSAAVYRPRPECRCWVLYQGKNAGLRARAASIKPNRAGIRAGISGP